MNNLWSSSFSHSGGQDQSPPPNSHIIDIANSSGVVNLDKFFDDVEAIKDELKDLETIYGQLSSSHEKSKSLHDVRTIKDLRAKMDNDVTTALKKAKLIKSRLEELDRSNMVNRNIPECGPGSSSERTRTSVVNGLRKKLQESMNQFQELRQKMPSEYRETVQRRYHTITGENPDESLLDNLISTGQSETFLQKAIQEQGRGQVMDTIMEIQERHDAVKDLERNLKEMHQTILDMAVLVQHQGDQIDNIQDVVNRSSSAVTRGTEQLQVAKKHQRSTRKWAGIILLLFIIFVILSLSHRSNKKK